MRQRSAVSAMILVAALCGAAQAAEAVDSSVEQRLKALEARVIELERRLEAKESAPGVPAAAPASAASPAVAATPAVPPVPAAAPRAVPAAGTDSPASLAPAQWHALKRGMSWGQVIGVLGKPGKKRVGTMSEVWFYPDADGGSVEFDRDGRVSGWSEP